ncbi:MAG: hypothetical protein IPP67_03865 [Rhodospirillaceae bacterium]|nr:hypothetical protein [Rhodospirillaceae bacterium]
MPPLSFDVGFTPVSYRSFRLKLRKSCYSFLFSGIRKHHVKPLWQQQRQLHKHLSSLSTHLEPDVGRDI